MNARNRQPLERAVAQLDRVFPPLQKGRLPAPSIEEGLRAARGGRRVGFLDVEYVERRSDPIPKAKQLAVYGENPPGSLAHIERLLP